VRAFAAEGARVGLHYHRGEERARELAEQLGGAPVLQADLTVVVPGAEVAPETK